MFESAPTRGSGTATAGPGLTTARVASWRGELAAVDRDLSDVERIDLIRELEDLKSGAAAAQARITADLETSRREQRARDGVPEQRRGAGIASEIALARRVSPTRGGQHLGLAGALVREMPHTLAALTSGSLSEWRATLLVRESACLSQADRTSFDEQMCRDVAVFDGWGDRRLVAEAKRIAYRLDGQSVVRRNRRAESERHVSLRPAPDTMSYLTGLLPVAQGVAVFAALGREADALRASGDPRSRGQIMADTMVERVTGQTRATDMRIEIQLVMTDGALFGGSDDPGCLVGYGTVPAEWMRDLLEGSRGGVEGADGRSGRRRGAGDGARTGDGVDDRAEFDVWVRRLFTSPSGSELVSMDSRARRAPSGLAGFIAARDGTCRTPWCDAPIRHIDHVTSHADGGATEAANLQGLCEACNYAKQAPGWSAESSTPSDGRHQVVSTTPTGHQYRSSAPPPIGSVPLEPVRLEDLLRWDAAERGPTSVARGELSVLEILASRSDLLSIGVDDHAHVDRAAGGSGPSDLESAMALALGLAA
ncbi:HNH endonuclease [Occultella kanbiaonis]|uniref:HNH endonuclease n=1 Tax=Occultella kanbiaonis TaxID=2675754 RepID=UPI0013D2FF19|nr:HNH endonuclease signature motif containing protein [Occultella kanbiaonis]